MSDGLILNGFNVDPRLAALMRRADWQGKRTSGDWLSRFPSHPEASDGGIQFVELAGFEWAKRESNALRKPDLWMLWGKPSSATPPGDVDPTRAYLIGFTAHADCAIYVDLRPATGPRIIYDNLSPGPATLATAFESIDEFVRFFIEHHGDTSTE